MRTIYEDLMINHWGLARPNLLISVTGIADDIHGIDGGLIDYFRRGLYESANSTQAWIISGGMNAGVMKEVGKARRKYSSAYGDEVPIIALPMWNEIELVCFFILEWSSLKWMIIDWSSDRPL